MNKIMYFRTSSFTIYDGTRVYSADWSYDGKKWFPFSKYFDSELEAKWYIDHHIKVNNDDSFAKSVRSEEEYREYRKKHPREVYQWWEPPCSK